MLTLFGMIEKTYAIVDVCSSIKESRPVEAGGIEISNLAVFPALLSLLEFRHGHGA